MRSTLLGPIAAACTMVAYLPQPKKCWDTGSAKDLSLKTFALLATGVGSCVLYRREHGCTVESSHGERRC
ncbi:MAG: PQ-loop repeat-containing protein [Alphaproteobacteria bacterium]|nr:MAG: PQ-loop repeat-containing protein [Alphaproteobacteria bacterium]